MTVLAFDETFPEEPVRILEGASLIVEQIQAQVITRLGQVSLEGSQDAAMEWMNQLTDSAERVRAVTDLIFKAINETHELLETRPVTEAEVVVDANEVITEPPIEQLDQPEQTHEDIHLIHEMLTFAMRNPGFRAEELKHGGNGFSAMSAADIRAARKLVVNHLAEHDVAAEWVTEGKTRGSRYTLLVHAGHDTLVDLLTAPQPVIPHDTVEHEVVVVPQVEAVQLPKQIERTAGDYTAKEVTLVELSLVDIISTRPMNIKEVVYAKFGVPHLPPHAFQQFRTEVQQAVDAGLIKKLKNGRLAPADYVESTQTAAELDQMIKDLRRESGIQALIRKPKQRQRGRR